MQHTLKRLPKSVVEITVELSLEDMPQYLQKAATQLSAQTTIPGFRPGKAPYEQVVARLGSGRVWEEAAQLAVPKTYSAIIAQEKLETIGSPQIDVVKLAPDNPFIFKAVVPLLPEIKLGDYSSIKLAVHPPEITDTHVDKVLADLRKVQTKEVVVERPVGQGDKVVVDMNMSLDTVPIDGGTAKNHSVYMDENHYIPGLKDQLTGLKKGDVKEFQLKFPKAHYQKMIAGKDVDFKIEVKDVFELQSPPLDDTFAAALGQKTLGDLRTLVRGNLEQEAQRREEQRQEIELLKKAVERTKFGDIPDLLINEETIKMLRELEEGIARQGLEFSDYLKKIGKTRDALRLELTPEALQRVKTALLTRTIAKAQQFTISEAELAGEVARLLELYKNEPSMQDQLKSDEAREYLRGILHNRKAVVWLKQQANL